MKKEIRENIKTKDSGIKSRRAIQLYDSGGYKQQNRKFRVCTNSREKKTFICLEEGALLSNISITEKANEGYIAYLLLGNDRNPVKMQVS